MRIALPARNSNGVESVVASHVRHVPYNGHGANVVLAAGTGARAPESVAHLSIQAISVASETAGSAMGVYLEGNLKRSDACNESHKHSCRG